MSFKVIDDGLRRELRKVKFEYQRNEPCPCGSGKKFKHCHLRQLEADELLKQKKND